MAGFPNLFNIKLDGTTTVSLWHRLSLMMTLTLHQQITNKQNTDGSLVLVAVLLHAQVLFKTSKPSSCLEDISVFVRVTRET